MHYYARERAGERQLDRRSNSVQPDRIDVAILVEMTKLSYIQGRASDMERDMELVRTILRTIREKPDLIAREIEIPGYDRQAVQRHVAMLADAGYVDGVDATSIDRGPSVMVIDLSWEGHEFYGALVTDEGTCQKVKAAFGPEKLATVPLKMMQSVATAALTAWAMKQAGLS